MDNQAQDEIENVKNFAKELHKVSKSQPFILVFREVLMNSEIYYGMEDLLHRRPHLLIL